MRFWRIVLVVMLVLGMLPVVQATNISTVVTDPNLWTNVTITGTSLMNGAATAYISYTEGGVTFTATDPQGNPNQFQIVNSNDTWYNWGPDRGTFGRSNADWAAAGAAIHIDFAASSAFAILLGTGGPRGEQVTIQLSNGDSFVVNTSTTSLQFVGFTLSDSSTISWVNILSPADYNYVVFDNVQFGTYTGTSGGGGDPPPSGDAPEISSLLLCASGLVLLAKISRKHFTPST